MQVYDTVTRLMNQFGQPAVLETQGVPSPPYQAFIQPLGYKNKMYLEGVATDLGQADEDYLLYLGPACPAPDSTNPRQTLRSLGETYEIRHCELIRFGREPLYQRGVLRRVQKGGNL